MKREWIQRLKALWAEDKRRAALLFAVGMAGIVLLGVSEWLPAGEKAPDPAPTAQPAAADAYARELEQRLQALLCQVEGAGRVEVMATLAAQEETVYAKDRRYSADGTGEESLVLPGGTAPALIETVTMPQIQGVAVLCEGGADIAVQSRITQIVHVLTGVGTSHITVTPMVTPSHEGG